MSVPSRSTLIADIGLTPRLSHDVLDIMLAHHIAQDAHADILSINFEVSRDASDLIKMEWSLLSASCLNNTIFEFFVISIMQVSSDVVLINVGLLHLHVELVDLVNSAFKLLFLSHVDLALRVVLNLEPILLLVLQVDVAGRLVNLLVIRRLFFGNLGLFAQLAVGLLQIVLCHLVSLVEVVAPLPLAHINRGKEDTEHNNESEEHREALQWAK